MMWPGVRVRMLSSKGDFFCTSRPLLELCHFDGPYPPFKVCCFRFGYNFLRVKRMKPSKVVLDRVELRSCDARDGSKAVEAVVVPLQRSVECLLMIGRASRLTDHVPDDRN